MTKKNEGNKVSVTAKKIVKSQKHLLKSVGVALQASCLTLAYGTGYCAGVAFKAVKDTTDKHPSLAFIKETGNAVNKGFENGTEGVAFNGEAIEVGAHA